MGIALDRITFTCIGSLQESLWTMITGDIGICSESTKHVEETLESCRHALERRIKLS